MKSKILTLFITCLLFTSCNKKKEKTNVIDCLNISNDKSYLFFERGFDGQKLTLLVNGFEYKNAFLNTDPVLDLADEILIKTDTVNSITLIIDGEVISTFCPYPFIKINQNKNQFKIDVVANTPSYE